MANLKPSGFSHELPAVLTQELAVWELCWLLLKTWKETLQLYRSHVPQFIDDDFQLKSIIFWL
jgi:hypothetical protein